MREVSAAADHDSHSDTDGDRHRPDADGDRHGPDADGDRHGSHADGDRHGSHADTDRHEPEPGRPHPSGDRLMIPPASPWVSRAMAAS
jgi:hypothetical protein